MPLTVSEIVDRLNWLSAQSAASRADLTATCVLVGHEPTGEVFLTTIPIETCYWCGAQFSRTADTRPRFLGFRT